MRILVVEDEPLIVSFLERGLRAEGYVVDAAGDADGALERLRAATPDLVLLDVMLKGSDGFDVLATIRAIDPGLPVIMLTARGDIADRVRGLDLGATDYVVKPFAFAELAARVRAHLRGAAAGDGQRRADMLQSGRLRLDLLRREVAVDGHAAELSAREFALLAYLMRHPGQVLSREQILSGVWGYAHDPRSNVVDVYVGYLRRKLAEVGCPDSIQTVRGLGYRLARLAA
jgi:two-component system, OmpR family, response regulator